MTSATNNLEIMSLPPTHAIIVAGGSGTRMQAPLPKQFLLLNGKPVLMYTLEAFNNSSTHPQLIVVLPEAYHTYWQELCLEHNFVLQHELVIGGDTRYQSVKNALQQIPDESLVAIHDAVRPLVSQDIIDTCYHTAYEKGNAVTTVNSRDSVRQMSGITSRALTRADIYLVQTPQVFRSALLKNAYQQPFEDKFTDDASVAEHAGHVIHMVQGNYENLKITFPEDIPFAELLLKQKAASI